MLSDQDRASPYPMPSTPRTSASVVAHYPSTAGPSIGAAIAPGTSASLSSAGSFQLVSSEVEVRLRSSIERLDDARCRESLLTSELSCERAWAEVNEREQSLRDFQPRLED